MLLKNIREASFRQTPLQRHLSTLEPRMWTSTGPGFLPFLSSATGFTCTGTTATANPFPIFL
jgi:hypothetical protein